MSPEYKTQSGQFVKYDFQCFMKMANIWFVTSPHKHVYCNVPTALMLMTKLAPLTSPWHFADEKYDIIIPGNISRNITKSLEVITS